MLDTIYRRRDPLAVTPIRVAVVVSLLAHAMLLAELPQLRPPRLDFSEQPGTDSRLTVRLVPPFIAPPASPEPPAPRARLRPPPPPPPPVIAVEKPAPGAPPALSAATPKPAPTAGDLMAYVDARRFARGDPAAADAPAPRAESADERASRAATANLATQRQLTFGYDPSRSGGVFEMERVTHDYAEFTFVGWNSDARRRTKQLIEVRKGNNSDIRIAVVRKMIAIIREHEPVEFMWDSQRLGRSITLSSRMRDNTGLEDFMLKEFF